MLVFNRYVLFIKQLFSVKRTNKHFMLKFFGLKLNINRNFIDKKLYKKFMEHSVSNGTVLLIEFNDCHRETLLGYYKLLKDLGYNVEILTRGNAEQFYEKNFSSRDSIYNCNFVTFDRIVENFDFSVYERIIYNSRRVYYRKNDRQCIGYDISEYYKKIPQGQKENIFVQHHIDFINSTSDKQIILANPEKIAQLSNLVVNPHYFGNVKITDKNKKSTVFITIGELSVKRKNSKLLINVVQELHNRGTRNFSVIVIGRGNIGEIPRAIQKYFKILGRVDFKTMYKAIEYSDFILPLLDPELEAHHRYLHSGTSGCFQLVYGFLKPCIIHKTFADAYGFDETNSIVYAQNQELFLAMEKGMQSNKNDYNSMQSKLNILVKNVELVSEKNFKNMLVKKFVSNKKFSIIVPIYNTEKYLEECIESIINQTYQNIEIILVNDGSPGNADEICRKYAQMDSRIKYFAKDNEGVAIARNFGIANASGDYIYCVDSDDTISTNFVEQLNASLSDNEYDMVILTKEYCKEPVELMGARPTCAFSIKKTFLDKHPDVRFQEGVQPCEDGLFSHKIMALTENIGKCQNVKYFYRTHNDSCEHKLKVDKILKDIPQWYAILTNFYDKHNLWENKRLHLLAFINNEPYGLRFCKSHLTSKEKKCIFNITHKFIRQYNLDKCNEKDLKNFSDDFRIFVSSSNYFEYRLRQFFVIKNFADTIFSIKEKSSECAKHKILTILGIRMKFKIKG